MLHQIYALTTHNTKPKAYKFFGSYNSDKLAQIFEWKRKLNKIISYVILGDKL